MKTIDVGIARMLLALTSPPRFRGRDERGSSLVEWAIGLLLSALVGSILIKITDVRAPEFFDAMWDKVVAFFAGL